MEHGEAVALIRESLEGRSSARADHHPPSRNLFRDSILLPELESPLDSPDRKLDAAAVGLFPRVGDLRRRQVSLRHVPAEIAPDLHVRRPTSRALEGTRLDEIVAVLHQPRRRRLPGVAHPHSLNPQTWHFTHPSAY